MNYTKIKTVVVLFFLISCNSIEETQVWQKGNLHTHSLWSDGDDFPEMIIQWYKDNDYQFLALSDHNTVSKDKNRWYKIGEREINNKTLEKYKDRFGDWVEGFLFAKPAPLQGYYMILKKTKQILF